jgi:hypothetical protein
VRNVLDLLIRQQTARFASLVEISRIIASVWLGTILVLHYVLLVQCNVARALHWEFV